MADMLASVMFSGVPIEALREMVAIGEKHEAEAVELGDPTYLATVREWDAAIEREIQRRESGS